MEQSVCDFSTSHVASFQVGLALLATEAAPSQTVPFGMLLPVAVASCHPCRSLDSGPPMGSRARRASDDVLRRLHYRLAAGG